MSEKTVKEIKQELDNLGVKYDGKARKDDLLKLLNSHQKEDAKNEVKKPKQKSYVVVERFKDLEDNDRIYRPGDKFNHVGKTKERIEQLTTKNNKIGKVLIKEVE